MFLFALRRHRAAAMADQGGSQHLDEAPVGPPGPVLMAAHKHIARYCAAENANFYACKRRDNNPTACLEEGYKVTSCLLDLCASCHLSSLLRAIMLSLGFLFGKKKFCVVNAGRVDKMREACKEELNEHSRCLDRNGYKFEKCRQLEERLDKACDPSSFSRR